MPEISITLVDHTTQEKDSGTLRDLIKKHLGDIFLDLLYVPGEVSVVNMRLVTSSPAPDDQFILHFVDDIPSSYVAQKLPGGPIKPIDAGVTRPRKDVTGSEFYKFPLVNGKKARFKAIGYAKAATHEALHNITGMNNDQLHQRDGVALAPPQLPVTSGNRNIVQTALDRIPNQLR